MARIPWTTKMFIEKSKSKFADKFTYANTTYINRLTRVTVTCKYHGNIQILPENHLSGEGCSVCSKNKAGKSHRLNTDEFITRSKKIHNNRYTYNDATFTGSHALITIGCTKHGNFQIKAYKHLNCGVGCPQCRSEEHVRLPCTNFNEFLNKLKSKPNFNNYDFSKLQPFKSKLQLVEIECKQHGKYQTRIGRLETRKFFGCKQCAVKADKHTTDIFVKRSSIIHNNRYTYNNSEYVNSHTPIKITCKKHGDYICTPHIHVLGGGVCPICTPAISVQEKQVQDFLTNIGTNYEISYRGFKDVKEIDIISHDHKIGIEMNGLYWHSDIFKDKNYHFNKTQLMKKYNYQLLHIFEDEWKNKQEICKSIIRNICRKTEYKFFARKCKIKILDANTTKDFLTQNHIQGYCISKYRYGLFFNDELIMIATFGKNRVCVGNTSKIGEYELLRLCTKLNTVVVGGASKLVNHFIKTIKPTKITSYCNLRYSAGNVYEKLKFTLVGQSAPNYFYVRGNKRYNRYLFRKNVLIENGFDKSKTEKQIMKELGYNKIYDCGNLKYEWNCDKLNNYTCFNEN